MSYPTRRSPRLQPGVAVQAERVSALLGERNRTGEDQAAVTRDAMASLGNIALKAKAVSAAPTAAEFNALLDDVRALAAVLNANGAKFTGL